MILAYEDEENGEEDDKKAEKRKTFQRNLEEQGLELELEPSSVSIFFSIFFWIKKKKEIFPHFILQLFPDF